MSGDGRQRIALVLSGGGANGAYGAGVVKALLSGSSPGSAFVPVEPDIFLGTSIGSFNAALLASIWDEQGLASAARLERAWLDRLASDGARNGVYRFRGDPLAFFDPRGYIPNPFRPFLELLQDGAYLGWEAIQRAVYVARSGLRPEALRERLSEAFDFASLIATDEWERTVRESIDFAAIRRSDRALRVVATNWTSGELRVFKNHDMTDRTGPQAILASSAIPGVFPPVYVGAEPYVDGGVVMNTPLRLAIDEGAEVIHVIYLDPDIAAIPLSSLQSTVAASYRLQTISWAALVNDDIADAGLINRGVAGLGKIERGEELGDPELQLFARGIGRIVPRLKRLLTYRPLTIHRYHPNEELSGGALGLLNLERGHIEELIHKGFVDAQLHNCAKCGCILAEGPAGEEPVARR